MKNMFFIGKKAALCRWLHYVDDTFRRGMKMGLAEVVIMPEPFALAAKVSW